MVFFEVLPPIPLIPLTLSHSRKCVFVAIWRVFAVLFEECAKPAIQTCDAIAAYISSVRFFGVILRKWDRHPVMQK